MVEEGVIEKKRVLGARCMKYGQQIPIKKGIKFNVAVRGSALLPC